MEAATAEVGDKGLKKNSIGFLDGLAIGLDSTAPAYSLAAGRGLMAPVLIVVGSYGESPLRSAVPDRPLTSSSTRREGRCAGPSRCPAS